MCHSKPLQNRSSMYSLFLHTTVNKTVHLTDQERFVVSYFRATFRQIEKVEEQMQSLTAYQLNKTSRKPETTARYQYLQAIFPQVLHTLFENPMSTISHRSVLNSRLNCGETLQQTPITNYIPSQECTKHDDKIPTVLVNLTLLIQLLKS